MAELEKESETGKYQINTGFKIVFLKDHAASLHVFEHACL
jgi:hypothetical protein